MFADSQSEKKLYFIIATFATSSKMATVNLNDRWFIENGDCTHVQIAIQNPKWKHNENTF